MTTLRASAILSSAFSEAGAEHRAANRLARATMARVGRRLLLAMANLEEAREVARVLVAEGYFDAVVYATTVGQVDRAFHNTIDLVLVAEGALQEAVVEALDGEEKPPRVIAFREDRETRLPDLRKALQGRERRVTAPVLVR